MEILATVYCHQYSSVLRGILPVLASFARTGILLHINACMWWKTHNSEPASSLQLVPLSIVVTVFATRLKTAMYRSPQGVPIIFVERFQRSYSNGHPALLIHGPYRGTTTTTIRTSTYTGIHSITVPILDVLLLLCFPPTPSIVPKLCRPMNTKTIRLRKSSTPWRFHWFSIVELLFLRKLSNFARSEPGEPLLLAVFVFGSAGPESV